MVKEALVTWSRSAFPQEVQWRAYGATFLSHVLRFEDEMSFIRSCGLNTWSPPGGTVLRASGPKGR